MTNRSSTPAASTRLRKSMDTQRSRPRPPGWALRRIRRSWHSPPPLPSIEEAEARIRSRPGFLASLSPEQIAFIKSWDGPDLLGSPNGPKRTYQRHVD